MPWDAHEGALNHVASDFSPIHAGCGLEGCDGFVTKEVFDQPLASLKEARAHVPGQNKAGLTHFREQRGAAVALCPPPPTCVTADAEGEPCGLVTARVGMPCKPTELGNPPKMDPGGGAARC